MSYGIAVDLDGQTFGRWTVIKRNSSRHLVRCQCGVEKEILTASLHSGDSKSCGTCGSKRVRRPGDNIKGKRFGLLTPQEPTDQRKWGSIIWRCVCDCGKEKLVSQGDLSKSMIRSCGCLSRKKAL